MKLEELAHLKWIYGRMHNVHKENENIDYMLRFKKILDSYSKLGKNARSLEDKKRYIDINKTAFDRLHTESNSDSDSLEAKWITEDLKNKNIYSKKTQRIDIVASMMRLYKEMYNIKK